MAKALSLDLRTRIVRAVETEVMSRRAAAARFGVASNRLAQTSRFFDRRGIAFKKTAHASKQDQPDVAAGRADHREVLAEEVVDNATLKEMLRKSF